MVENMFQNFLKENKIEEKQIEIFISLFNEYQEFLGRQNLPLETVDPRQLVDYTEHLVASKSTQVLDFLRTMINYANYSKKYDFIVEVIDIAEAFNAMDTLYSRIAEVYGEPVRDEIFDKLAIPPLGVHPEKKPEFTKLILKRTEEKLSEEKTIKLLSPCLHGRPPDPIEKDKKDYRELGIDAFLAKKYQTFVQTVEKVRDEGTLLYSQYVDDEVVNFVKNNPTISAGLREGNIVYVTKTPYQTKKYLHAENERMKRFYCCHCPWVRGAIKDGTAHEIPATFCHCSAGWYKLYWDQIFEQSIKIEPVETALGGALVCKFAIHLPEDTIK
ncbi:MAG: hypothetical protein ACFFC7_33760 [Candidatus Hermodarchaeota archaeon]